MLPHLEPRLKDPAQCGEILAITRELTQLRRVEQVGEHVRLKWERWEMERDKRVDEDREAMALKAEMEPFEFVGRQIAKDSKIKLFAALMGVGEDQMEEFRKLFKPPRPATSETGSDAVAEPPGNPT